VPVIPDVALTEPSLVDAPVVGVVVGSPVVGLVVVVWIPPLEPSLALVVVLASPPPHAASSHTADTPTRTTEARLMTAPYRGLWPPDHSISEGPRSGGGRSCASTSAFGQVATVDAGSVMTASEYAPCRPRRSGRFVMRDPG
jgi:hypothetical protein